MKTSGIYKELVGRKYLFLFFTGGLCILSLIVDVSTGPARLSISDVFFTLITPERQEPTNRVIIWIIRLPMALMAVTVGAALSIAGVQMQTILSNPLASPYTLGISAGAGFGAALALVMGVGLFKGSEMLFVPLNAFFFSLVTSVLIFLISKIKGVTMETMILAGIAMLFLFNAMLTLLQYLASEEELQAVIFWLFGSLLKTTWLKLGIGASILFPVTLLLLKDSWKLTALRLGTERAKALGINVDRLRLKVFILISVLTAASVSFVGTIGFIGLVGPHIARIFVGEDQRFLLPMSALTGALLLSAASTGSKLIVPGTIFPIGIVTSFIGVPFFLSLILLKRKGFW